MSEKRKLLVISDSGEERAVLKKMLDEIYEICEAQTCWNALDMLVLNNREISAVLLDLTSPALDGYEFLEEFEKRGYRTPVLVISRKEKMESERSALSFGAADFVVKPYDADMIRLRVKNAIKLQETNYRIQVMERDFLTGLYSRDAFYQHAQSMLNKNQGKIYDIICLDIENFKLINDIYGYAEGDRLLQLLAKDLEKLGFEDGLCGRIGADIFAAFVPHQEIYKAELFEEANRRINQLLLQTQVTVRYGIYSRCESAIPVKIMCDRAIMAINTIKGKYHRYHAYYNDAIREKLLWNQQISGDMRRALENREFHVYYQPKYDLVSEKIAGAEALVRWIHPIYGLLPPDQFIPLFEQNGFIAELDFYVWDAVCQKISEWKKLRNRRIPVSVNVSRVDLYREDLPEKMQTLIQKYELKPEDLHLEITESAYTENPKQVIGAVQSLKNMGFVIEMDDFGKGYSSLNMLSELPIDILKLDIRFIQKHKNRRGKSILGFIVSLAKWMGFYVVAEGVETREQIDLLRSLECDYVQGYYYAKPLPMEEFEQQLMQNASESLTEEPEERVLPKLDFDLQEDRNVMLVIDDVEVNREVLAENFSEIFKVEKYEDGRFAVAFAAEHHEKIAVILLDLMMPDMDGFQVLKELKSRRETAGIPVVITSIADEQSEEEAILLGADAFVSKPYYSAVIRHTVAQVLKAAEYDRIRKGI